MQRSVPFHRPSIGEEEIAEVVDSLRSGWLTTGPEVERFQRQFAAAVNARHAVALTSATAALGLRQLDRMSAFQQRREQIACRYTDSFGDLDTCFVPRDAGYGMHAWHLYILELNLEALAIDRNDVIERLRQKGVGTSLHFIPLNLHPVYQRTYGYQPGQFPTAEAVFERACSLPIHPGMTDDDVDHVIDAVRTTLRASRR